MLSATQAQAGVDVVEHEPRTRTGDESRHYDPDLDATWIVYGRLQTRLTQPRLECPRAYPNPTTMSSSAPLFDTIEPDEPEYERRTSALGNISSTNATQASSNARPAPQMATNAGDAESGVFRWLMGIGGHRGLPMNACQVLLEYYDR